MISNLIEFNPPTTSILFAAVLAALLLLLSAFASGSEIAFFSLSPKDLSDLDPAKSVTDKKIQLLRDDNERTLATILITNNFVNVTIIMILNYVFSNLLTFHQEWLEFLCITVFLTFFASVVWRDNAKGIQ